MRQKCFTLLFLLTMALAAVAAETSATWCLIVESVGGEKIAIALKQKPVISTEAEGYKLTYGETTAEFAWSELKKLTLEETVPSAVKDVQTPSVSLVPGEITIRGAEAGSLAQVYAADGRQVLTARVADSGEVRLSTAGLPAGIYVVKTTKSTFKIVKK
jgi:hypothetical protein